MRSWLRLGNCTAVTPRAQANTICDCTERGRGNHSCCPSRVSRHGAGPRGRGGLEFWCSWLCSFTMSSNLSGQLLWQVVGNKSRHGLRAYRSCLSNSPTGAHRASSTFQTRSALQPSLNQHHLVPHVSLSPPQQSPCQTSCGQARVRVVRLMATPKMPTSAASEFSSRQKRGAGRGAAGGQEAAGRTVHALKTQWVGWSEWGPIKKWLPVACNADFLLAQETHLPRHGCARKDGGRAMRRRSSGRRSMASGSPPSRRRAAREARGLWLLRRCGMVWRRLTAVQATGGIELCKGACLRFATVHQAER